MRATGWARSFGAVGLVVVMAMVLAACNPVADDNRSAVISIVSEINDGAPLNSDVRLNANGGSSVREDEVAVELRSIPKSVRITEASELYTVVFHQVTLVYTRPDGLNEPGVDVPFPLVMGTNIAVDVGGATEAAVTVVTNKAKLEPPLRNLWFLGELEITATGTMRFLGEDQAGNNVEAVGTLQIFFADFADDN